MSVPSFVPSVSSVALCLIVVVGMANAFPDDDDPALERAKEIGELVKEHPEPSAKSFSKRFLAAVPTTKLGELLAQMHAQGGKVVSVKRLSGDRLAGKFELVQAGGQRTECSIGVLEKAPHKIEALWLKPLGVAARSLGDLEEQVAKLPGKTSFAVARLSSRTPALLAGHEPDEPLAIGSAFKLYVLGQLLEDVETGARRWTDSAPLRAEARSLPSGMLHAWKAGSPVTLHTLASLMISISDNTATDNLIELLGRDRIERHLDAMGASFPDRSRPFLETNELFRLKWGKEKKARRYLESDVAGKRAILSTIKKDPLPDAGSVSQDEPILVSELEWFASANDLVRALDWIRRTSANDEQARSVLSINDGGLGAKPSEWRYVGFKGGSEPGVLELAWVLERRDGAWFVVALGWNDPKAPVDLHRLFLIAAGAVELLGRPSEVKLY